MSLQLIFGGSGFGKTTFLYDTLIRASVENPQKPYILIVPEQFTMQAQKDIVTRHPVHGTMNIDIVSFQRLAYRVFEELALEKLQVLDDMGKTMVLRKVAASQKKELTLFSGHLNQAGFVSKLRSMLSEFVQYGITPDMLEETAPLARSPLLRMKLEEFASLYRGFQAYIQGHYITTEEVLEVLCRVVPRSGLIKDSVIMLDGYMGFTPVQYRLLELLMVYARQVAVTVTTGREQTAYQDLGVQELFHTSCQMAVHLSELAQKNGVSQLQDIRMGERKQPCRFTQGGELEWLERHLFRYPCRPYPGSTGEIELFQADSLASEVAQVASRIRRFLQEGLRYRDMAVITGDLQGYGKEIAHQFEQNGIPAFLDDKKSIMDHPAAELVRAALEVIRSDFAYEPVFRFLKTGLVTQDTRQLGRLENYVVALGIRGGKRWRERWEQTFRGAADWNLDELNEFRDQVMAPLFAMQEAFRKEELCLADMVSAVRQLLEDCQLETRLEERQLYFHEIREYRLEREYGQIYERISQLLDRLSELLGEERVSRREFMEILDAGFSEISVGAIPATADRVVVGDLMRTRLAHIKVLFFVGVNDGIIPAHRDEAGLLSDREREFFGEQGFELAPTAREDSFRQRFYLYVMMTKPSKHLIVSFAGVGQDGKSRRPSFLVGELRRMFPALACRREGEVREPVSSKTQARRQLIAGLRQFRDGAWSQTDKEEGFLEFLELYRHFALEENEKEALKSLLDAAFYVYQEQGIGHAVAQALYGNVLSGSVTRLEQYAACAYGHFLKYGLELMERQHFELAAADIGNLFHDSIDLCFRKAQENGWDWKEITDEQRTQLVKSCVRAVTSEYGNTILGSSARNAYLARRVEAITQRTIWALQQQLKKGDFYPAGFEVSFSAADRLEAMRISLTEEESLHLRGRIDRLDLCEDGQKVYVKIIDYKSGSTSFDLLALYYGLQLQLVVYMDAVMEMTQRRFPGREIVPAGILYYNIADPLVDKGDFQPEQIDEEILRQLKMNGLINSELEAVRHLDTTIVKESDIIPVVLKDGQVLEGKSSVANRERFYALRRFVKDKLKDAGCEILDGQVGIKPYKSGQRTACDYCPYHAVCGFDKKTPGFEFKRWRAKKTEEIWEEVCQKEE